MFPSKQELSVVSPTGPSNLGEKTTKLKKKRKPPPPPDIDAAAATSGDGDGPVAAAAADGDDDDGEAPPPDQDGASGHSPALAPPSSASSLPKEHSQVELELRVLEALEIYSPFNLQGIHRHFVLYGLMEYLRKSFGKHFTADEVMQILDRFFNLEMLKPEDDEADLMNQEEDFSLPRSYFVKEEQ